tara:strand:+ start:10783 stop:12468 length:1686 start_codon:yes stop_codon:yes gene_type:complete
MHYAYLFEARGIQRFLFASGKLKDMQGGSELLDYVCADGGLLDQVLEKLNLSPGKPRNAGGVFYLLFENQQDARRFQAVWRMACANWIPGIEQVDTLSQGQTAKEAIDNGHGQLRTQRNQLIVDLPRPGPLSERSPRTGLAAVKNIKGESLDVATAKQRVFERTDTEASLAQRFLNEANVFWPTDFEESAPKDRRFPLDERRLVGLIHADGNGLGELLRVLNTACQDAEDKTYIQLYKTFSDGLTDATLGAAREASKAVLLPEAVDIGHGNRLLPARPLVLGGDDLTIVTRADLALPYTEKFLKAFEQYSHISMDKLRSAFETAGLADAARQLPKNLTACAGISYMKCSQPFLAGHELAEGLCKRAKDASRKARTSDQALMPSSVAFHKVQDSLLDDAKSQFDKDNRVNHQNESWQLALPVYGIHADSKLPALDALNGLVNLFAKARNNRSGNLHFNDRPLRELVTLWRDNPELAKKAYGRWYELADRNNEQDLQAFDDFMTQLIRQTRRDLPCSSTVGEDGAYSSPISDLLHLLTIRRSAQPQRQPATQIEPAETAEVSA